MKKQMFCLYALLTLIFMNGLHGQGVAINTDGSLPNANAILDVKSSTKGILIPRLDYANRPTGTLATGMLIYVTANGPDGNNAFYYYDGTSWLKVRNNTEQQTLSLSHDTIYISGANYVPLGSVFTNQGYIKCGTNYINPSTDNQNCGACGNVCPPGQACGNGTCSITCQAGLTNCTGTCVNLQTDLSHCGNCVHVCAAGQICVAGACVLSCQAGLTNCGGICRDLTTDFYNCGACGTVCTIGKRCLNSICQ